MRLRFLLVEVLHLIIDLGLVEVLVKLGVDLVALIHILSLHLRLVRRRLSNDISNLTLTSRDSLAIRPGCSRPGRSRLILLVWRLARLVWLASPLGDALDLIMNCRLTFFLLLGFNHQITSELSRLLVSLGLCERSVLFTLLL